MSKRPAKPEGMSWTSPYFAVKDPQATLDFYKKAFGLEQKEVMKGPDGKIMHAEVVWRDQVIMFGGEDNPKCIAKSPATSGAESPVSLYLYCEDVDAQYERATKAGAKSFCKPETQFWGDRMCAVKDPDGYMWTFATNVADFDPTKAPS